MKTSNVSGECSDSDYTYVVVGISMYEELIKTLFADGWSTGIMR